MPFIILQVLVAHQGQGEVGVGGNIHKLGKINNFEQKWGFDLKAPANKEEAMAGSHNPRLRFQGRP